MADKVVIITGASSGFGRLAALEAAAKGYAVVVTARRAEKLDELVREIEAAGGAALAVPGDVTSADDQARLIREALARFGRIDVLVNNAGVPLETSFADAALADLRRQWATNVTSIVELTKQALPSLLATGGIVINVGSGAGHFSIPGWGLYAPTKVAVASINDALRRELRPMGVRVCLVEPGPYRTEFSLRAGMPPAEAANFGLPPIEVARAIVRLIERPRRVVVVPFWMGPFVALGAGLVRLFPGLVDLVFVLRARRGQRRQSQPV